MKQTQLIIKKNQGLSLIEMMVSMVLGLFLVGGLSVMYLGSKKSDKVRDAVSDIEENARLTLNALRDSLEHAGYKSINNISLDNPFQTSAIPNPNCRDTGKMVINSNLITIPSELTGYTMDGDVNSDESDRITVKYRADNPSQGPIYFDCNGKDLSYSVSGSTSAQDTARQLACSTDNDNGVNDTRESLIYNALYVNPTNKTLNCIGSRNTDVIAISENIENMQIRYGVTQDKKTTYKKAGDVDASKFEWEAVTSIQVAILVGSEREVLDHSESKSFDLLDETISIDADRKLYRTFSTTIHLPNRSRRELQTVTRTAAEAT